MSAGLQQAVLKVAEQAWRTIRTEADGTLRQWAEMPFVPGEPGGKARPAAAALCGTATAQAPGRVVCRRLGPPPPRGCHQPGLGGGAAFAVAPGEGGHHRAGSDEVKNALGGGHLPSQHFNANAAWFKLALLAYNPFHKAGRRTQPTANRFTPEEKLCVPLIRRLGDVSILNAVGRRPHLGLGQNSDRHQGKPWKKLDCVQDSNVEEPSQPNNHGIPKYTKGGKRH